MTAEDKRRWHGGYPDRVAAQIVAALYSRTRINQLPLSEAQRQKICDEAYSMARCMRETYCAYHPDDEMCEGD